jgi:DNA-binding transcriptional LysR family regulator
MGLTNVDLDTVRTLVTANELGTYAKAASRLGRTASAISLQMKRLQDQVGAVLFRRDGRSVVLTEAGQIALRYGRRLLALNDEMLDTIRGAALGGSISIGLPQDFADTVLPAVLSRFTSLYPLVLVEVRIEGSTALVDAVTRGQLDATLAIGHADRPTGETMAELELAWIAGERFVRQRDQPLPLVLLGPQCAFRQEAIQRLDGAGCRWRVAATSPSLSGLWGAALGGLGVTMRSRLNLPPSLVSGPELLGLPRPGSFPVTLHAKAKDRSEPASRLRALMAEALVNALPTPFLKDQAVTSGRRRRPRAG